MVRIILGDCLEQLGKLADCSVHCCVTSPPYWGLRDYGTGTWEGGNDGCDHREFRGGTGGASLKQVSSAGASTTYQYRDLCKKCGAIRIDRQLGLESTPEEYVAKMVEIFREVRRVLRDDGTCWINLGSSYAGSSRGGNPEESEFRKQATNVGSLVKATPIPSGYKPKDLIPTPWLVAMALQADGWYLRQDIIWAKPNPMPESVRDRCTKSHEYIFLLSKSARYHYDAEAIREPVAESTITRLAQDIDNQNGSSRVPGKTNGTMKAVGGLETRNRRSVWTVTTQPYKGAHFATFPTKLIEPCILAGCPEGGTVLDPFVGSGTTLEVAIRHNRDGIGIELNPEYVKLARQRIAEIQPILPTF